MRIDSHQHFWKYTTTEFGWIGDNMSVLKRDFLPNDLRVLLSEISFDGTITVQARQSLEETRWLLHLASENEFIKGVVGWVDLCSTDVEKQLDEFSKHPKFKGVRHVLHDEADDYFMLKSDFLRGVAQLEKYGLTYDLLLFPKHLPVAFEFVRRFPNQKFVIDHISKPFIKNGIESPWKEDIAKLSSFDNVYCKLSGMVTEADWQHWKPEDFKVYLDTVFNYFGVKRLMIGSDWPVCSVAGNYSSTIGLVIDYIKTLNNTEIEQILGSNCCSFYNI